MVYFKIKIVRQKYFKLVFLEYIYKYLFVNRSILAGGNPTLSSPIL